MGNVTRSGKKLHCREDLCRLRAFEIDDWMEDRFVRGCSSHLEDGECTILDNTPTGGKSFRELCPRVFIG
jgi:hypothetical protein